MNLLFAINTNFVPRLQDCAHSIALRGGADKYNAYVLHSDLSAETQAEIIRTAPPQITYSFVQIPEELFQGFPVMQKRYPLEIYYRLAAPKLLPAELDRILYLDVDTVVINSLTPLYRADFDGNLFMACTHTKEVLSKVNRVRLGISEDVPYINTGVMLMNLGMLRDELDMQAIRSYALEHKAALMLPDQDILTALYGTRVKLLDSMVYNLSELILALHNADPRNEEADVDWVRQNSVIVHYCGKNKPWNSKYIGVLDAFYHELKAT